MSDKIIFDKPFDYKHTARDDVQQSNYISYQGREMFSDMNWRMYESGRTAKVGIDCKKYTRFNSRKMINQMKRRMTR